MCCTCTLGSRGLGIEEFLVRKSFAGNADPPCLFTIRQQYLYFRKETTLMESEKMNITL